MSIEDVISGPFNLKKKKKSFYPQKLKIYWQKQSQIILSKLYFTLIAKVSDHQSREILVVKSKFTVTRIMVYFLEPWKNWWQHKLIHDHINMIQLLHPNIMIQLLHPNNITWRKWTFRLFEVEAPNGINLIMLRDTTVTVSAKAEKKIKVRFLVINLLMLQNRGYSALNGLISHRVAHKTCIF